MHMRRKRLYFVDVKVGNFDIGKVRLSTVTEPYLANAVVICNESKRYILRAITDVDWLLIIKLPIIF